MSEFQREFTRYLVFKKTDINKYLSKEARDHLCHLYKEIHNARLADRKQPFSCVCVESDWPEYEPTWKAIEDRVNREGD